MWHIFDQPIGTFFSFFCALWEFCTLSGTIKLRFKLGNRFSHLKLTYTKLSRQDLQAVHLQMWLSISPLRFKEKQKLETDFFWREMSLVICINFHNEYCILRNIVTLNHAFVAKAFLRWNLMKETLINENKPVKSRFCPAIFSLKGPCIWRTSSSYW